MPTVGIVSPGAMGSAVGNALVRGGATALATLAGRSARTRGLATEAGIALAPDLAGVVREADVIFSVVPPEAALAVAVDVARAAREQGLTPAFVDLNAVSPATARTIAEIAAEAGIDTVDGSISGPPPWQPGTRIYLSGARAGEVAALPLDGVQTIVVGDEVGLASAVKMSTASVYKGSSALLLQALLAAQRYGVLDHVVADLRSAAPELVANVERRLAFAASKSGRYVAEMREIAATQENADLTPALFEAIAAIYDELARTPAAKRSPEEIAPRPLAELLDDLRPS